MEKSSSQTTKSIFRNVLFGFSTWILPLALSFFATPIIVSSLGDSDYGIYALVLGFIGYSFNFSIGRAITKYIAEYRVSGETEKISDVVTSTLFLNILVGFLGGLSICLLAETLVIDVFQIKPTDQTKTIYAFYICSGIIFLAMLNQVFNSILQGLHRFDVYSKVFNTQSIVLLAGNIVLVLSGFGLITLLMWNLIVLLLICGIVAFSSLRLLTEYKFSLTIKKDTVALVLKYSSAIIGYQILANVLLLFERGWITRQLGSESLTYYVVPMLLGFYIHGFVSSFVMVMFPLASELDKDRERLVAVYKKATKIVCMFVAFLGATLIVESRVFLTVWMGETFAENSAEILILHAISFSLLAILTVSWQMTEGLGYPSYNCFIYSICLIISLVLMITLIGNYEIYGVAIARLAGFSTLFLSIFYVEKWFFKEVQIRFWLKIVGMIGLAILIAAATESVLLNSLSVGWISIIFSTVSGGLVYCLVLWLVGFVTKEDRNLLEGLLRR